MYKSKKPYLYGADHRKPPATRVYLFPSGTDAITISGRNVDGYFGLKILKLLVHQPLTATDTLDKMDIIATIAGDDVTGQADAIRHGVARALLQVNPEFRAALKAAGFPAHDPRTKKRKKYGLKAVRRVPQLSER